MRENVFPELEAQVKKGIYHLKNGGLVAYPTDTVYGLGACSDNEAAVRRVYTVKNRPPDMPLPLLLADISWIDWITDGIPPVAKILIAAFMPGALTLVMQKSRSVSDTISGGKDTVALRVPGHPVTLALIRGAGCPVIGTSANISGKPSPLTAGEVVSQLGDRIDFVIDGGKCPGGVESTILDVTGDVPVILREGAVSRAEIENKCRLKISGRGNLS